MAEATATEFLAVYRLLDNIAALAEEAKEAENPRLAAERVRDIEATCERIWERIGTAVWREAGDGTVHELGLGKGRIVL